MTLASRRRSAFTLLEVVLTLSMAVVLMALVGAALQFYTTNISVRDADVRRVHLASSILQMISDDLRAALQGSTFDSTTLETFLKAAAPTDAGAATAALDPAAAATLGTSAADETTAESPDLVTSTLTLTKPGLIGNQSQLQFDISRLPRLEQWTQTFSTTPGVIADIPSDTKTVTYYVQAAGTIAGVMDPLQGYLPTAESGGTQAAAGGLVRREIDRAASNWATESGGLTGLMMTGDLIATEVTSISFEYYDGSIWQMQWNSDDAGNMPQAVRITLTLSEANATGNTASLADGKTVSGRSFTHTVKLPVTIAATEPTESTAGTESTGTTDTTGATGSSAPGGTGANVGGGAGNIGGSGNGGGAGN